MAIWIIWRSFERSDGLGVGQRLVRSSSAFGLARLASPDDPGGGRFIVEQQIASLSSADEVDVLVNGNDALIQRLIDAGGAGRRPSNHRSASGAFTPSWRVDFLPFSPTSPRARLRRQKSTPQRLHSRIVSPDPRSADASAPEALAAHATPAFALAAIARRLAGHLRIFGEIAALSLVKSLVRGRRGLDTAFG